MPRRGLILTKFTPNKKQNKKKLKPNKKSHFIGRFFKSIKNITKSYNILTLS